MSSPISPHLFDAVIPHHPKDATILPYVVTGLRQNAIGLRNIYVVSQEDPEAEDTIWIPETSYPFSKAGLRAHLPSVAPLSDGWYLQQLLKLYAHRVIPGCLSHLLWFDSDILLRHPTAFMDASGTILLDVSRQNHLPYFEHAERLLGNEWSRVIPDPWMSGIADHMLVRTDIVDHLLSRVEARAAGQPAWKAILDAVHPPEPYIPGMSEYELYFNFALRYYPTEHAIRPLRKLQASSFGALQSQAEDDIPLVCFHSWFAKL